MTVMICASPPLKGSTSMDSSVYCRVSKVTYRGACGGDYGDYTKPQRIGSVLHRNAAGPRIESHPARDPFLRGQGADLPASRRQHAGLHHARPWSVAIDHAGQNAWLHLDLYDMDPTQLDQIRLLQARVRDRIAMLEEQQTALTLSLKELRGVEAQTTAAINEKLRQSAD